MIASMSMWFTGYLIPWMSGFLVFAIILMMVDMWLVKNESHAWVPSYRKWYNRSREPADHLPPGTMGWLFNQPLTRQHNRTLVISGIQSLIALYHGSNAIGEFIAFLVEAWVMLPGLWLGVFAFRHLSKQDEFVHKAEALRERITNTGFSGIVASLGGILSRGKARAVASIAPAPVQARAGEPAAEAAAAAPAEKPRPKSESMSASDILRRHEEGRKL